jgi:integrase
MASLVKKKTTSGFIYHVDTYYHGKRIRVSTGSSDRKTALRILRELEHKIALGTFNLQEYDKKEIQVSDFFGEYFRYATSFKKETTLKHDHMVARRFTDFIGSNRTLRSIDTKLVDQFTAYLAEAVNPTTFNIWRRFLHAAFNVALKWSYVEINPIRQMPKMPVEEVRNYFTIEEIQKLFALIDSDIQNPQKVQFRAFNVVFRRYIEFLLNTGLRRTEATNLKVDNIDFNSKVMYVEKTKGKKYRAVPLNNRAMELLKEMGPDLFNKIQPSSFTHKFGDVMVRLGMKGFKLHGLRHTFATNLVRAGVDIYAVKELLGHQDIRTSMVYAKADTETLRKAVDLLKN